MKAAVYHGPNDIRIEEAPLPEIGERDMLIKVLSASICGTDLRIYHGQHRMFPPGTTRIPGHEVVGEIVKLGQDVTGYNTGQRVFIAPNAGCGHCKQCVQRNNNLCKNYEAVGVTMDGGFAEYMRVPANSIEQGNVIPVSESIDPAAAALMEPFACVLRGQNKLGIQPGDSVLIIGAGPIGIMHLKLARVRGAGWVIVSEPSEERAEQAKDMGVDVVIDPGTEDVNQIVLEKTEGRGADVIIIAAPVHSAQESALDLAAIGGRINFFGGLPKDKPTINFNSNQVHYKELIVTGTTACSTADCWQAAEIVNAGLVDLQDLVSERCPLEKIIEGFRLAEDRKSLKIAIVP